MSVRQTARVLLALTATLFGLCQAKAQTFPPAWLNTNTYAAGDMVTEYGNWYRCLAPVTKPYYDPSKYYQYWEPFYIRNNTTVLVGVGQPFPTLAVAWNYIRNARVAQAVYLHLSIVTTGGALNESFSAPLNLDQESGALISIIGDHASNIQLTFTGSNGLSIDSGHTLGSISQVSLIGHGNDGIFCNTNACIPNLDNINIDGFGYQIFAQQSGRLVFGPNIVLTNSTTGCTADDGGAVTFAPGALTFTGFPGSGNAIYADRGSRIVAEHSSIQYCYAGASSNDGSSVDVSDSSFSTCDYGCQATTNGSIKAESCTFSSDTYDDLYAITQGVIDASGDDTSFYSATNGGGIYF